MKKKAIVWIREDLRIENHPSLSYASQNHEIVSALYIYNDKYFDKKREAQKWWLSKSLNSFKKDLLKFNITLEILSGDEVEIFSRIKKKDDISVYWNKVYEPDAISR
jgi:deoxyribodipyrimidine photo-lyase